MKTASGVIALILGLLTLLNVASCSKADKRYRGFVAYGNSAPGAVEGFLRGWQGGSRGDPFGAALEITDQERTLQAEASDARWAAWVCLVGTVLAAGVCMVVPARPQRQVSPVPSETGQRSNLSAVTTDQTLAKASTKAPDVEGRLRTLRQLHEASLISAEEYEARSQQILEEV